VTTLALISDYVMRTGAYDPKDAESIAYKDLPQLGKLITVSKIVFFIRQPKNVKALLDSM
jgi:hypothetical protein